jgi:hypothetical protein
MILNMIFETNGTRGDRRPGALWFKRSAACPAWQILSHRAVESPALP